MLAFFIDIDSTLMYRDVVPEANVRAILAAQKEGHLIFINSGRSFGFIPPHALLGFQPDGFVTSIGSRVVIKGETVFSDCFDFDRMYEAIRPFAEKGYPMHVESHEGAFAVNHPNMYYVTPIRKYEELKQYRHCHFTKITILYHTATEEELELLKDYHCLQHPRYLEVSMKGYTKASGMLLVAEKLGLSREQLVAVGDSKNDLDMIAAAGTGVAVGDAEEAVKNACDLVVAAAPDGGVADAIYRLTGIERV